MYPYHDRRFGFSYWINYSLALKWISCRWQSSNVVLLRFLLRCSLCCTLYIYIYIYICLVITERLPSNQRRPPNTPCVNNTKFWTVATQVVVRRSDEDGFCPGGAQRWATTFVEFWRFALIPSSFCSHLIASANNYVPYLVSIFLGSHLVVLKGLHPSGL